MSKKTIRLVDARDHLRTLIEEALPETPAIRPTTVRAYVRQEGL